MTEGGPGARRVAESSVDLLVSMKMEPALLADAGMSYRIRMFPVGQKRHDEP